MHAYRYLRFRYETLKDLVAQLEQGDWLITLDFKSGYHHVPMHPDTYPYLGVELGGQVYVMTALAFGIAPACREFTQIMQLAHLPLRRQGERMASYIDDTAAATAGSSTVEGQARGKFHAATVAGLHRALGLCHSVPKCHLLPQQRQQFLGLIVDAQQGRLWVPQEKIHYFRQQLQRALDSGSGTPRQLASLAGMLLSFQPAMHMAPLFARGLFGMLSGQQLQWDVNTPLPQLALQDLHWWAQNLEAANGSRMWRRQATLCMASDASETAHAAYMLSHQHVMPSPAAAQTTQWSCILGFTQQDHDRMRTSPREFHSTIREVRTVHLALSALAEQHPHLLRQAMVQWFSDSQAGVALLKGMKGDGQLLEEVRQVYLLAFR